MKEDRSEEPEVVYIVSPSLDSAELNDLYTAAWEQHERQDLAPILRRSLLYICAYRNGSLVGFVYVAWDGGVHGFLLEPTVRPDLRRCGIGSRLVLEAASQAAERGVEWLHVDFEPQLRHFYESCGFRPTEAGLLWLGPE